MVSQIFIRAIAEADYKHVRWPDSAELHYWARKIGFEADPYGQFKTQLLNLESLDPAIVKKFQKEFKKIESIHPITEAAKNSLYMPIYLDPKIVDVTRREVPLSGMLRPLEPKEPVKPLSLWKRMKIRFWSFRDRCRNAWLVLTGKRDIEDEEDYE